MLPVYRHESGPDSSGIVALAPRRNKGLDDFQEIGGSLSQAWKRSRADRSGRGGRGFRPGFTGLTHGLRHAVELAAQRQAPSLRRAVHGSALPDRRSPPHCPTRPHASGSALFGRQPRRQLGGQQRAREGQHRKREEHGRQAERHHGGGSPGNGKHQGLAMS